MLAVGTGVIASLGWLCSRPVPALRVTGILFAASVAGGSALAAFALVADNPGAVILARPPGVVALFAFAATATGAASVAVRGLLSCARPGRL